MKIYKESRGFSVVVLVVIILLFAVIGVTGVYVFNSKNQLSNNKKTEVKSNDTLRTDTDCFVAEVPKEYQIVASTDPQPQNCQFSAYIGTDAKNPESSITILPYKTLINSEAEARKQLQTLVPNAQNIKTAKVGGYNAVGIEGNTSSGPDGKEKFVRTFVVYSPKQYSVKKGEYEANAFLVNLILLPIDASKAYDILGIRWK